MTGLVGGGESPPARQAQHKIQNLLARAPEPLVEELRRNLRFGAPLPRSSYCHWMKESDTSGLARARRQYVAKVRAAGSWAAYEKAHIARLVPVLEKIFPRPRLPHEIASHVVRFCFHTGDYCE